MIYKKMSRCVKQTTFLLPQKMHDMVKSKNIPQFTLYILVLAIYDMKEGNQHFLRKGTLHFLGDFEKHGSKSNWPGSSKVLFYAGNSKYLLKSNTVFPHIVSALEQFPPLNSFRTFTYYDLLSQYI